MSKCSWPTRESGRVVNDCVVESPFACNVVAKEAKTISSSDVAIQYFLGFLAVALATLAQIPESFSSIESKCGIFGQKIQRPKSTRRAGRKVRTVTMEHTIPIAPTGPRPRLFVSSLRSNTKSPIVTVLPEAMIGSTTPRHAIFIASKRDS